MYMPLFCKKKKSISNEQQCLLVRQLAFDWWFGLIQLSVTITSEDNFS